MSGGGLATRTVTMNDADIQRDLVENVVLAGGLVRSVGEPGNFLKALRAALPKALSTGARVHRTDALSEWLGGSILSGLSMSCGMWISDAEYAESGLSIVHRKCYTCD